MKKIYIYSDGACSGNQTDCGKGGYASILRYGEIEKVVSGNVANTTNNRMELMAIICSLREIKKKDIPVYIFSDSGYIVNCINDKWYEKWIKNNWKREKTKEVLNQDLWKELLELYNMFYYIKFYHVKGNLKPNTKDYEKYLNKFISQNKEEFTEELFLEVLKYNKKVDEIAVSESVSQTE